MTDEIIKLKNSVVGGQREGSSGGGVGWLTVGCWFERK